MLKAQPRKRTSCHEALQREEEYVVVLVGCFGGLRSGMIGRLPTKEDEEEE